MLLFNVYLPFVINVKPKFQNISCYCLTMPESDFFIGLKLFQNISCYCLTYRLIRFHQRILISKHLMLLFNDMACNRINCGYWFQNISCYCLTFSTHMLLLSRFCISKHLMLLFNQIIFSAVFYYNHFKTSHVIV